MVEFHLAKVDVAGSSPVFCLERKAQDYSCVSFYHNSYYFTMIYTVYDIVCLLTIKFNKQKPLSMAQDSPYPLQIADNNNLTSI